MNKKASQTIREEWFNSVSHGITALCALPGFAILIIAGAEHQSDWSLFSAIVYGISLIALYSFSTLYHGLRNDGVKKIFKILDHCGIFLLIAGTYTPVLLISFGGSIGWTFFGFQWGLALMGIVLKIFYTGKFKFISTLIYAIMGWIIVLKIDLLKASIPDPAYSLLIAGGYAYTVGILFYLADSRFRYAHFIWHLFVMAGSVFHYLMMIRYIFV